MRFNASAGKEAWAANSTRSNENVSRNTKVDNKQSFEAKEKRPSGLFAQTTGVAT